jgi:hypothetical protein
MLSVLCLMNWFLGMPACLRVPAIATPRWRLRDHPAVLPSSEVIAILPCWGENPNSTRFFSSSDLPIFC